MDIDNINVSGVIIKEQHFGNTSKIVKIFTRQKGLLSILAKGAYAKKSHLSSLTNLMSSVELTLQKGKSFYYIKDGELIDNNHKLSASMKKVLAFGLAEELISYNFQDEQVEEEIYMLFVNYLENLKKLKVNIEDLLTSFILKFVSYTGYRPRLTSCVRCGCRLEKTYSFLNFEAGLVCEDCLGHLGLLDSKQVQKMAKLLYLPMGDIENVDNKESKKLLEIAISYAKDVYEIKKLRSEIWLKELGLID